MDQINKISKIIIYLIFVIALSGCKIYYHIAPISLWINSLKSEDENVRMEVAEVLSSKKANKFLTELISALEDNNRVVRYFIIIAKGYVLDSGTPSGYRAAPWKTIRATCWNSRSVSATNEACREYMVRLG